MDTAEALTSRCMIFDSLEDAQISLMRSVLDCGHNISPRKLLTREIGPLAFALQNPRRRCITHPFRRWSLPLAIGEFCWHACASDSADFICYYASRWREFATGDGLIQGSCYGKLIFGASGHRPSQWQRLKSLLQQDPASRRAVLNLHGDFDELEPNAPDVACAISVQFLIRDNKLDAIVHMRSNDIILGMPYDIFLFSMLQELLAEELGLELGFFYHLVGSLHIYERHLGLARRIVDHGVGPYFEMPRLSKHEDLSLFLQKERSVRVGQDPGEMSSDYWNELLKVLVWYKAKKEGNLHALSRLSNRMRYAPVLN